MTLRVKQTLAIFLATVILSGMGLGLGGCAALLAGGAGAGGVAFIKGDLEAILEVPLKRSLAASLEAITDLGLIKISDASDQLTAKVIARTAQDEKVTLTLEKISEQSSLLKIRVGVFGNEALSQKIMVAIQNKL